MSANNFIHILRESKAFDSYLDAHQQVWERQSRQQQLARVPGLRGAGASAGVTPAITIDDLGGAQGVQLLRKSVRPEAELDTMIRGAEKAGQKERAGRLDDFKREFQLQRGEIEGGFRRDFENLAVSRAKATAPSTLDKSRMMEPLASVQARTQSTPTPAPGGMSVEVGKSGTTGEVMGKVSGTTKPGGSVDDSIRQDLNDRKGTEEKAGRRENVLRIDNWKKERDGILNDKTLSDEDKRRRLDASNAAGAAIRDSLNSRGSSEEPSRGGLGEPQAGAGETMTPMGGVGRQDAQQMAQKASREGQPETPNKASVAAELEKAGKTGAASELRKTDKAEKDIGSEESEYLASKLPKPLEGKEKEDFDSFMEWVVDDFSSNNRDLSTALKRQDESYQKEYAEHILLLSQEMRNLGNKYGAENHTLRTIANQFDSDGELSVRNLLSTPGGAGKTKLGIFLQAQEKRQKFLKQSGEELYGAGADMFAAYEDGKIRDKKSKPDNSRDVKSDEPKNDSSDDDYDYGSTDEFGVGIEDILKKQGYDIREFGYVYRGGEFVGRIVDGEFIPRSELDDSQLPDSLRKEQPAQTQKKVEPSVQSALDAVDTLNGKSSQAVTSARQKDPDFGIAGRKAGQQKSGGKGSRRSGSMKGGSNKSSQGKTDGRTRQGGGFGKRNVKDPSLQKALETADAQVTNIRKQIRDLIEKFKKEQNPVIKDRIGKEIAGLERSLGTAYIALERIKNLSGLTQETAKTEFETMKRLFSDTEKLSMEVEKATGKPSTVFATAGKVAAATGTNGFMDLFSDKESDFKSRMTGRSKAELGLLSGLDNSEDDEFVDGLVDGLVSETKSKGKVAEPKSGVSTKTSMGNPRNVFDLGKEASPDEIAASQERANKMVEGARINQDLDSGDVERAFPQVQAAIAELDDYKKSITKSRVDNAIEVIDFSGNDAERLKEIEKEQEELDSGDPDFYDKFEVLESERKLITHSKWGTLAAIASTLTNDQKRAEMAKTFMMNATMENLTGQSAYGNIKPEIVPFDVNGALESIGEDGTEVSKLIDNINDRIENNRFNKKETKGTKINSIEELMNRFDDFTSKRKLTDGTKLYAIMLLHYQYANNKLTKEDTDRLISAFSGSKSPDDKRLAKRFIQRAQEIQSKLPLRFSDKDDNPNEVTNMDKVFYKSAGEPNTDLSKMASPPQFGAGQLEQKQREDEVKAKMDREFPTPIKRLISGSEMEKFLYQQLLKGDGKRKLPPLSKVIDYLKRFGKGEMPPLPHNNEFNAAGMIKVIPDEELLAIVNTRGLTDEEKDLITAAQERRQKKDAIKSRKADEIEQRAQDDENKERFGAANGLGLDESYNLLKRWFTLLGESIQRKKSLIKENVFLAEGNNGDCNKMMYAIQEDINLLCSVDGVCKICEIDTHIHNMNGEQRLKFKVAEQEFTKTNPYHWLQEKWMVCLNYAFQNQVDRKFIENPVNRKIRIERNQYTTAAFHQALAEEALRQLDAPNRFDSSNQVRQIGGLELAEDLYHTFYSQSVDEFVGGDAKYHYPYMEAYLQERTIQFREDVRNHCQDIRLPHSEMMKVETYMDKKLGKGKKCGCDSPKDIVKKAVQKTCDACALKESRWTDTDVVMFQNTLNQMTEGYNTQFRQNALEMGLEEVKVIREQTATGRKRLNLSSFKKRQKGGCA